MNTMLAIGDINVDILMGGMTSPPVVDREIACETFELAMGSSAVIAACTYNSLGGQGAVLGLAGNDEYGEFMLRGMKKIGVDTARIMRTSEVGTGVTVNLIHGRTRSQITYPGTISAFDGASIDSSVFAGVTHAHFAGCYQQTNFRPHITRLLHEAGKCGVSTSLDPQWDASECWEYMDEWLPLLTYFFANEDEAMSLTGADDPETALTILAGRTGCPIVKTGRRGAVLLVNGTVEAVPTYRAEVVDTTGAGDSFAAGFLYAVVERGLDRRQAAAFGNAVGARSCLFKGGVAARTSCAEALAFMETDYECV